MKKLYFVAGIAAVVLFTTCTAIDDLEGFDSSASRTAQTKSSSDDETVTLGDQLENPYTISNMQEAYESLSPETRAGGFGYATIAPTDVYLKFTPADEDEYDLLLEDKTIDYFNYPLDYELVGEGIYRDPLLGEDDVECLYAAVPVGKTLPNVSYVVLDSLFIPEHVATGGPATKTGGGAIDPDDPDYIAFLDELEGAAMEQTGNDDDAPVQTRGASSNFYPTGTLKAYDHLVEGYVPLEGVKVRLRRLFHIETVYTDANGWYRSARKFRGAVNYSIIWERAQWDIRGISGSTSGTAHQAHYNGPKQKSDWSLNFYPSTTTRSWHYATIHRGLYRFCYKSICGLRRYTGNVTVRYNHGSGRAEYSPTDVLGIYHRIIIYGKDTYENWKSSNELLNTVFHELGHHLHFQELTATHYIVTHPLVKESWANYVGWLVEEQEYRELGVLRKMQGYTVSTTQTWGLNGWSFPGEYYGSPTYGWIITTSLKMTGPNSSNRQSWNLNYLPGDSWKYTPMFIDLADDLNQRVYYGGSQYYPNDKLRNFSPAQIREMINSCASPQAVKTYVRGYLTHPDAAAYYGVTAQNVDDFFAHYLLFN